MEKNIAAVKSPDGLSKHPSEPLPPCPQGEKKSILSGWEKPFPSWKPGEPGGADTSRQSPGDSGAHGPKKLQMASIMEIKNGSQMPCWAFLRHFSMRVMRHENHGKIPQSACP